MTYGNNGQLKTVFHAKERKLIRSYLESYKVQLEVTSKYGDHLVYGKLQPKWIELNAKKELCEKLLG